VILADSVRNYMTKFLNDDWMIERGFLDHATVPSDIATDEWWVNLTVAQLPQRTPLTVLPDLTVSAAVDIMQKEGFDQIPVVTTNGDILGVVTEAKLTSSVIRKKANRDDRVDKFLYKQFKQVGLSTKLGELSRLLDKDHFVLVTSTQCCYGNNGQVSKKTSIFSIVTRIDLLNLITSRHATSSASPTASS